MSNPYMRRLSLAGIDLSAYSVDALRSVVHEILRQGIHGICFSPYLEGQGPGHKVSEDQVRKRLEVITPTVRWVRTFSCTDGHERIPQIAAEYGLKTMVGVWLDDDLGRNEQELAAAIEIAGAGHADILAVGNEVLLRGDLTENELIDYISRTKRACPGVPVGYVDAYFKFADHPRVSEACDVILANCYPFWEGCPAEHALLYMKEMYGIASRAARGKPVIVSETGWPNIGSSTEGAEPSYENAIKYFIDTSRWAEQDEIEIFYFSAFDEAWKVDKEGDVGAFWGLWDKDGQPKFA
jgi:exo-beta-1,3-glucanase (GH17 family)